MSNTPPLALAMVPAPMISIFPAVQITVPWLVNVPAPNCFALLLSASVLPAATSILPANVPPLHVLMPLSVTRPVPPKVPPDKFSVVSFVAPFAVHAPEDKLMRLISAAFVDSVPPVIFSVPVTLVAPPTVRLPPVVIVNVSLTSNPAVVPPALFKVTVGVLFKRSITATSLEVGA